MIINRLIALLVLIILLPAILIISIVIILDDGFPIIFKQTRVGLENKHFNLFKFRSMKKDMKDIPSHLLEDSKNYFTNIGPWLRKYSVDEIPQLFNILTGEMNFVGPRPALYNQKDLITLRKKFNINGLKPGITGWAQVNGRDNIDISEKVRLDKFYLENRTFSLNFKIILLTMVKVFRADNVKI